MIAVKNFNIFVYLAARSSLAVKNFNILIIFWKKTDNYHGDLDLNLVTMRSISKFDLGRSISDFEVKNKNFAALHFCVCPQRTFLLIFIALYNFIEVSARSKAAMTILEF